MSEVKIIEGELYSDERGVIASLNNFKFDSIRRCYFVRHSRTDILRGWNGHRYESKWFYPLKGTFAVAVVRIDDMENPKPAEEPSVYILSDKKSEILAVPAGHATCLKALEKDSIIMVGSDKLLEESKSDSYKFDSSLWMDWSNIETK